MLALILFSVDRSKELYQYQKPGVNDLLNALGRVFNDRYRADNQPSLNSDDPDETWFAGRLREAVMNMEPLCITPTALKSPNNSMIPDNGLPRASVIRKWTTT